MDAKDSALDALAEEAKETARLAGYEFPNWSGSGDYPIWHFIEGYILGALSRDEQEKEGEEMSKSKNPNNRAARLLRKQVAAARGVKPGTIIRFTRTLPETATYLPGVALRYAAIFAANRWYLTGQGQLGRSSYAHGRFMELLAQPEFSEVAVATEFEEV